MSGNEPRVKQHLRRGAGGRTGRRYVPADDIAEVARQDRRCEVLRLRVGGQTIRGIAKELNISVGQAHEDLKRAIGERGQETKDELRALGNEALEAVLAGHLEKARAGDDRSGQVVIRAIREHARINGYESPRKVEMTGAEGGPIVTHDDILSKLARIAAASTAGSSDPKPDGN